MHTIYYGTNNPAKVSFMKDLLKGSDINIAWINELPNINHNINESGNEPLENARIKALHYYKQINKPVFSADSGLFFKNISDEDQPGTQVRRVNGKNLTDKEMIEYYSQLAGKYGGEIIGYYKNAMCVIINDKIIIEKDDGKINSEYFILSSKSHKNRKEGFPLDSLSKDIKTGKYYYDLNKTRNDKNSEEDFKKVLIEIAEKLKSVV